MEGEMKMTNSRLMQATLRFDGGHRRSIDAAAYGFTLKDPEGKLLAHEARTFGYTTHNVAEYRGMIAGLLRAAKIGVTDLEVRGDSRVVIYQMTGAYQAKAEHLAALRDEANRAALKMRVEYLWNRRCENAEADALVKLALDENDLKRNPERPKQPAKARQSAMAGLSKAKLRSYLLEHTTVPDKAWNTAYGAPAREDGENRETYIRRTLA
jgi:ribonuclease HI